MKSLSALENQFITVQEYLDGEQQTEIRHEYINGKVHAMGGASAAHNLISLNLVATLRPAARKKSCQLFMADMKVSLNIAGEDIFYHPDLLLSCDPDDREDYYRKRPCLIVEVLSPTTERIDRREKFLAYTSLTSLKEYIIVSQKSRSVTLFRQNNNWKPELFTSHDTFSLNCLDCTLTVEQIYEEID